jgi:hypothetical protein
VRFALEIYLGKRCGPHSAYQAAQKAGLIGCVRHLPGDLSVNRLYFELFGRNK